MHYCVDDSTTIYIHFLLQYNYTCPVLTDPDNGIVQCSLGSDGLPTEGDTCAYQCDAGYIYLVIAGDIMVYTTYTYL